MDYGNAELCSRCGEKMFIMPNPSPYMLEASPGYKLIKEKSIALLGHFDEEDIRMAFCEGCEISAYIGTKVTIQGTVVGDN